VKQHDGAPFGHRDPVPNQRLRRERELRNWTQEELADKIGTTFINVSRWERGITFPGKHYRAQLCEVFEKNPEELGLLHPEPGDGDDESYPYWFLHDPKTQPGLAALPPELAVSRLAAPDHLLVGRGEIVRHLKEQLCRRQAPVALTGLPGVGKTALAAALVHDPDILQQFPDGVLWAGLGPQPSVLGLLGAWGAALGFAPTELARLKAVEDRVRALQSVMGMRRMLLVVDDAWEAEPALAFKVGGPYCGYLVTTRFPSVAVRLARDAFTVVQELSEADGVALLEQLAPEVVRSEPDAVRTLVRSVDGLPLALTLMGRFLRAQAYGGQPRRVNAALELLKHTTERLRLEEPASPDERSPSLRATQRLSVQAVIEVSEHLLDQAARVALRALALFPAKPNSFSEEAALAVSAASAQTLDVLSDAGLIESSGPGRYALHRTIADYARHTPTSADKAPPQRFVRYFIPYVEAHAAEYTILDQESNNALAALELAFEQKADQALVRGVLAIAPYLKARGLYSVAETQLRRAEQIVRALGDGGRLARILMHLGRVADLQGDRARADAFYAEGLKAARASGDREAACALLAYWGEGLLKQDDFTRAEQYAREGLTLARELGHRQRTGVLLRLLGEIADARGEYAQGEALSREGLAIAREIRDWETASALLQNLGANAERRGDYEGAEQLYKEGLALARERGHRQRVSALLMHAGVLALRRRHYDEADALLQESLTLARTIDDRAQMSAVLQNLGTIASQQERYAEAEACLQESLEIARSISRRWQMSETLTAWGEMLFRQEQLDRALALFQEASSIARQIQGRELSAMALYGLARIAAARGDYAQAHQQGGQSRQAFEQMGHEQEREVARWLATLPPAAPRA
jgi:tetratricopeptide (TPR) repeat protein/transcriptional regulator with XRE-family HTH domain